MPRPAQFTDDEILDATARLAAADGPGAATIAAIGRRVGAPSGSIYHRFSSRDQLLAKVWLRTAAAFQQRFIARLAGEDPRAAGLAAAISLPQTVRDDPVAARILIAWRREDFMPATVPDDLRIEATALAETLTATMRDFSIAAFGSASPALLAQARLALSGIPLAAVRPYILADEPPPAFVETLIERASRAVLYDDGAG